jgi:hypothetical protein
MRNWKLVFTIAVLFVTGAVVLGLIITYGSDSTLVYKQELVNLTTKVGVEGQFFLGSGFLSNEATYLFTERNEKGQNSLRAIPASIVIYYEDIDLGQGQKPFVEYYRCNFFGCGQELPNGLRVRLPRGHQYEDYYVLHIPKSSVVSFFDLDLNIQR